MQPFKRDLKHSNANSNHSNQIPSFERKFELFEHESKHLNANANHSNKTQSIQMQILSIRIKFEAFESNSKHLNATIQKGFEAFECKFEPFQPNSIIRTQVRTIRTRNETFECKC